MPIEVLLFHTLFLSIMLWRLLELPDSWKVYAVLFHNDTYRYHIVYQQSLWILSVK